MKLDLRSIAETLAEHGYHAANKLRDAELTIQLDSDSNYKIVTKKIRQVQSELLKLGESEFDMFDLE